MVTSSSDRGTVGVADFRTGQLEPVMAGVYARYAASGHIVVVQSDGTVLAAPFDQDALEVTGAAIQLFEGVAFGGLTRFGGQIGAQLALSQNGDLLYRAGAATAMQELVWVTRDGTAEVIDPGWTGQFDTPALSPDGTRLAITIIEDYELQLWIKNLDRGPLARLTLEGSGNQRPAWTPDGQSIAFISDRGGNLDLYARRSDGSALAELLLGESENVLEARYSADGEWLLYRSGVPGDLFAVRVGMDSGPVTLVATEAYEGTPVLSPDGRWLAYVSAESGQNQVYVRPFPNTDEGKWLISIDGGTEPMWAHSGRELFYKAPTIAPDGGTLGSELVSVEVLPGTTFVTGEHRSLFSLDGFANSAARQEYDVTADDQRFVMIQYRDRGDASELIVIENFFEELKAKVGN
jgi:hypothetical protein